MTSPFDSQFFLNDQPTDTGTTGNLGGGMANTPTPTPTPVLISTGICQADGDCRTGYICDSSNPTFPTGDLTDPYGVCRQSTDVTTPICPPQGQFIQCSGIDNLGIFAGGESPPGQPCNTFTAPTSQCGGGECPPVGTFIRCTELQTAVGVIGEFSNGLQNGVCSSYTAIAEQCSTVYCNMTDQVGSCATILGSDYTGEATRTVNVLVNGQPVPANCTTFPGIGEWDTSECTRVATVYCNMTDQYRPCTTILGDGYTGEAFRTVNVLVNGQPVPANCTTFPGIGNWDTSECTRIEQPNCPIDGTRLGCAGNTGIYYTGKVDPITNTCITYRVENDVTCIVPACEPFGTFLFCEYDEKIVNGVTIKSNAVFAGGTALAGESCPIYRGDYATCGSPPPTWRVCNTTERIEGTIPPEYVESRDGTGVCYIIPAQWRECGANFISTGTIPENYVQTSDSLGVCYSAPDAPPQWRECGTLNPVPGTPPENYIQATDSLGICYTAPTIETWRECNTSTTIIGTPPNNFIESRDASGFCYNEIIIPPPLPSSTPQLSPTTSPILPAPSPSRTPLPSTTPIPSRIVITYRDCISGVLNEGLAPQGYREVTYTGAGGGTCWEPGTVVGFQPSLSDALTFTYQRGGSNLPQPKSITANNPSYGVSYRITMRTNPDIIVQPSSFTISPRSSQQFFVNVTPTLLDKLGDGTSTIEMSVDISEV
jgi:hypothetical protein